MTVQNTTKTGLVIAMITTGTFVCICFFFGGGKCQNKMLYDSFPEIIHAWERMPLNRKKLKQLTLPQVHRGHCILVDNHVRLPKGMAYMRFNSHKKCIGYRIYNCCQKRSSIVHIPVFSPRHVSAKQSMQVEFMASRSRRNERLRRTEWFVLLSCVVPNDLALNILSFVGILPYR